MECGVYVASCQTYEQEEVNRAVVRVLAPWEGMASIVRPGQRVAVKPNLILRKRPEDAATTHPAVVEAVVRQVQAAGGHPLICDSPGGPFTAPLLRTIYKVTGMEGVAQRTGAELNYDTGELLLPHPGGKVIKNLPVIKVLAEADLIIAVPKLKTHGMTLYTGAVKLMYGAIPGLKKAEYHFNMQRLQDFSQLLIDIVQLLPPAFVIMDAVWGMEGDGPTSGDPRHLGVMLGGVSSFAMDMVGCRLAGLQPGQLPMLQLAVDAGIAPAPDRIMVQGDPLPVPEPPFKLPGHKNLDFNLPPLVKRWLGNLIQPRPVLAPEICSGCGQCNTVCPAGAVTLGEGPPIIDLDKCIRCYCCQEMCTAKAIKVHQPWLGKKLLR